MIPPKGSNDQGTVLLNTLAGLCADSTVASEENDRTREIFLRAISLIGPDRAWELVSEVEKVGWEYNTATYHSLLMHWIVYRAEVGTPDPFAELAESQLVLLLTLGEHDGEKQFLDHLSREFGLGSKRSGRGFSRRCEFTADQSAAVSKLAYALSQAVSDHSGASPIDLVYAAGLHTFVELVENNPNVSEYPPQWAAVVCAPAIAEGAEKHVAARGWHNSVQHSVHNWLRAVRGES
jgi:hypothetical protein